MELARLCIEVAILAWLVVFSWLHWVRRPEAVVPVVTPEDVTAAVRLAYLQTGRPAEQFARDYDLARDGKVYDVLHHAAKRLNVDPELRTVGDVEDWLTELVER